MERKKTFVLYLPEPLKDNGPAGPVEHALLLVDFGEPEPGDVGSDGARDARGSADDIGVVVGVVGIGAVNAIGPLVPAVSSPGCSIDDASAAHLDVKESACPEQKRSSRRRIFPPLLCFLLSEARTEKKQKK